MATTPLTSGSWTILFASVTGTSEAGNGHARTTDMSITSRHKIVQARMLVTAGAVPAGGIPWPDKGKFGFTRNIDNIIISNVRGKTGATVGAITASGQHVLWAMNISGKKARVFGLGSASGTAQRAFKQYATTLVLSAQTLYVTVIGW